MADDQKARRRRGDSQPGYTPKREAIDLLYDGPADPAESPGIDLTTPEPGPGAAVEDGDATEPAEEAHP